MLSIATPEMKAKRPLVMLTLGIAETYNKVIEYSQSQPKQKTTLTDEKGYFVAYENQDVHGYIVKKALGQGSFGRVMLVEGPSGLVAMKICRAQPYFIQSMKTEIAIFKDIAVKYPQMTALFGEEFTVRDHVCYTMQLFDMTLFQALKMTNGKGFSFPQIRMIARQFATWLINLQNLKIVHTDMKPENMVMFKDRLDDIKLIDFGSAVQLDEGTRPTYIQSRFYRAPEITYGIKYGCKLDSWSIGGLLLELHTAYTVFPARSSPMLVKMFVSLLGLPPKNLILDEEGNIRAKVIKYFTNKTVQHWEKFGEKMTEVGLKEDSYVYLTEEVLTVEDRPQCFKRKLEEIIVCKDKLGQEGHKQRDYDEFYEMISGLLKWNQEERWGGQEMMGCAFLREK